MNREGTIDAILTDDVDAFLFGAETIIRMYVSRSSVFGVFYCTDVFSPRSVDFKDDKFKIYHAHDCAREVRLSTTGMILVALLSGGDYDKVSAVQTKGILLHQCSLH